MPQPRKKVPVHRKILVVNNSHQTHKVDKEALIKAANEMKEGEEVVSLFRDHGYREAQGWGMGMDKDTQVWVDNILLEVQSYRDETDDEYFQRIQNEERTKKIQDERDKLLYLTLKAKYEIEEDQSSDGHQETGAMQGKDDSQ